LFQSEGAPRPNKTKPYLHPQYHDKGAVEIFWIWSSILHSVSEHVTLFLMGAAQAASFIEMMVMFHIFQFLT
jgi:hypothetical protein